jgi:hypothetical protein
MKNLPRFEARFRGRILSFGGPRRREAAQGQSGDHLQLFPRNATV